MLIRVEHAVSLGFVLLLLVLVRTVALNLGENAPLDLHRNLLKTWKQTII